MKEIDLRNMTGRVSPKYIDVPQPMLVLHSTQELINLPGNKIVIDGVGDFYQFMKTHNLLEMSTYANIIDLNVWLATGEKFVPDYFTEYDVIMWKLEGNQAIPTDNCYIRLYFVLSVKRMYLLFTSSGLFSVSLTKYELSAAVKSQYIRVATRNTTTLGNREHYQENLKRLLDKKTSTVRNTRLFYILFSRESPYFLNVDEAIKVVYGGAIKAKDRKRLIESFNFQRTFLKELEYFMPELKLAFQKNITDDQMVNMALTIFDKSTEKGTTDDMIKAYDLIYQMREDNPDNTPGNVKLVQGKGNIKSIAPNSNGVEIELFDEASVAVNQPPEKDDEEDAKEEKKRLAELREETGAVDYTNRKDAY